MASVLLTVAGSAAGAAIPGVGWLAGPLLGTLGASIGTRIDGALGLTPTARTQGPRLDQLRVQDSREGAPQPIIYGTLRTAGNIIWASSLIETRHATSVGGSKTGSARATTYSYAVHIAVGVAAGPISAIHRIWADSKLIYDAGLDTSYADAARIYKGSATQTPDALIQSYLGSGNVPAYRGSAYVVLENLQLAAFGNRIPNLTFEVEGASTGFVPVLKQEQAIANVGGGSGSLLHRAIWRGSELLLPGTIANGAQWQFVIEHYAWQNTGFVRTARVTSALFANHGNMNYALSPDGSTLYLHDMQGGVAGSMVLYDAGTQSFGAITPFTATGTVAIAAGDAAWLDAQTILVKSNDGVTIGVWPIMRAGLTLILPANSAYLGLWSSSTRKWVDDTWLLPATSSGATQLLLATDTVRSKVCAVRLQRLNGKIVTATIPDYTTGSLDGTSNNSELRVLPLSGSNFLLLRRTPLGKVAVETVALATSAFAQTRAATALAVGGTISLGDAAMAMTDTLVLTDQYGGAFRMAQCVLTDTGFTLTNAYTAVAGSYVPSAFTAFLTRLSPYDFAYYVNGTLYWLQRGNSGNSVAGILGDLAARCGLVSGDLALTAGSATTLPGFAVTQPMPARAAAEQVLAAAPFTLAESDFTLRLTDLRTASATILPNADQRAANTAESAPVTISRARRRDVPRALALSFMDASNAYQGGSVRAALDADPQSAADTTSLPLVLTQGDAQAMAERLLASAQAETRTLTTSVSRSWLALDVGDLLQARGMTWRVTRLQQQGGLIAITAKGFSTAALTASALAPAGTLSGTVPGTTTASLEILDLPPLRDTDGGPGIYLAATAPASWPGGVVYDATGTQRATLNTAATAGIAASVLADGSADYMDRARSVTVAIPAAATLSSCTEPALYACSNLALLGSEIIQFQTATLTGPQTWQLSNLLRGRFGTEAATATHAAGERFIMLESTTLARVPLALTDRNRADALSLVTLGQSPGDVLAAPVTYGLISLQPFAPARLTASKATTGDITIGWQRRARVNNGWADNIDVPLDVAAESYAVDIMNGGTVVRTFSPITNSVTYTAAQQVADFGAGVTSLSVAIAQISDQYGRGQSAATTFTF